jgi:cation diffusion facilitator CzcD-associated flavoprotein CzcO
MGSIIRSPGAFNVKRIAVIGAGPSGLAVAKYLLAEHAFDKIDIYEQQYGVSSSCDLCFTY